MKYLLMLYEVETDWDSVPEDRQREALERYGEFVTFLTERGIEFYGEALRPSTTATSLRAGRDGPVVTDGPYVESTEHLGGFYVVDVANLDEALEVARRCPTGMGTEIRPIWVGPAAARRPPDRAGIR